MSCKDPIKYVVSDRDSLHKIEIVYGVSVEKILEDNPHIDPYNLQLGQIITICPNEEEEEPQQTCEEAGYISAEYFQLSNEFRRLWQEHVMWIRMLIISMADELADVDEVTSRLLWNPEEMGNLLTGYYGKESGRRIADLLTEHIITGKALAAAAKSGDTKRAQELNERWYVNADAIAAELAALNPYFEYSDLGRMWEHHLDQIKQEAAFRTAGDYDADIHNYDAIEEMALAMADYLTEGIMAQFS